MRPLENLGYINASRVYQPLFYIQNAGHPTSNCLRWWRPEGNGYTSNLDEAWKVTADKAAEICRQRPKEDIPWPVADVDELCQRHVVSGALDRLAMVVGG